MKPKTTATLSLAGAFLAAATLWLKLK